MKYAVELGLTRTFLMLHANHIELLSNKLFSMLLIFLNTDYFPQVSQAEIFNIFNKC